MENNIDNTSVVLEQSLTNLPAINKPEFDQAFKALPQEIQTDLQTKGIGWKQFGIRMRSQEIILQMRASKAVTGIKNPATIQEVPAAEQKLTELKSIQSGLKSDRLNLTRKLEEVSSRLMEPEKSIQPYIEDLTSSIVKVKSAYQKELAAKQAKTDEERRIKEYFKTLKVNTLASFRQKINNTVTSAHELALNKNIDPLEIGKFIESAKSYLLQQDFTICIIPLKSDLFDDATMEKWLNEILTEPGTKTPAEWQAVYRSEIDLKFSAYEVDFANREAAIEKSKQEAAAKLQEITNEHIHETVAAKIEAIAEPLVPEVMVPTKDLKRVYEIDMEQTWKNQAIVMAAFVSNLPRLEPMLNRVNNKDAFTIGQMKNYLGKLKTEDNSFDVKGLVWREVEKL